MNAIEGYLRFELRATEIGLALNMGAQKACLAAEGHALVLAIAAEERVFANFDPIEIGFSKCGASGVKRLVHMKILKTAAVCERCVQHVKICFRVRGAKPYRLLKL